MHNRLFVASTAMLLIVAFCVELWAAPKANSWHKVKSLSHGSKLTVELKEGMTHYGKFVKLSDNSIFILEDYASQQLELPKSTVRWISVERRPAKSKVVRKTILEWNKWRLIAAGVGFGIGFGMGYGLDADDPGSENHRVRTGAIVGGILAAGSSLYRIGYVDTVTVNKPAKVEVIYESRQSGSSK
jgi:hypothetical protein